MATFTSKANGNWSASGQTTWNESGVPGNGDTVTISHNVVVDVNTTVGASPGAGSGTAAILMNTASKTLTIATGVTLTCRGDFTRGANGAQLILSAGAVFEFDASQAGTPATAIYKIDSSNHNFTGVTVVCNGSTGSHCVIRSNASGANGNLVSAWLMGNGITATYTDFLRLGSASLNCIKPWPSSSGVHVTLSFCTFTSCGGLNTTGGFVSGCNAQVDDCTFSGSLMSYNLGPSWYGAGTGTRSVKGNGFDADLGNAGSGGTWTQMQIEYNVMKKFYTLNNTTGPATWHDNVIWWDNNTGSSPAISTAKTDRNYLLYHHATQLTNVHGFGPRNGENFFGYIIEPGNTDTVGDLILPSGSVTASIKWNLVLPNKDGAHCGQFVSLGGNSSNSLTIEHNTWVASVDSGESGAISYGETYAGTANIIASIKSNLVWSPTGAGYVFQRRSERTAADGCAAANITHNGKYNLSAGNLSVNGYSDKGTNGSFVAMFSTGTPGANDITADPKFADPNARMSTWAAARGYTSSSTYDTMINDAITALKVDPRNRVPDLIAYVSDGWRPTNDTYKNAGHDSVTTGALEISSPMRPKHERNVRGINRGVYAGAA